MSRSANNDAAERVIAQSAELDRELAGGIDCNAISARFRLATLPGLLRQMATEADAEAPVSVFRDGVELYLAGVASSLAGYLSGDPAKVHQNAIKLLIQAAKAIASEGPYISIGEVVDRPKGTRQ